MPKKSPGIIQKRMFHLIPRESFSLFFGVLPLNHVNSGVHHKNQLLHGKIKNKKLTGSKSCPLVMVSGFNPIFLGVVSGDESANHVNLR